VKINLRQQSAAINLSAAPLEITKEGSDDGMLCHEVSNEKYQLVDLYRGMSLKG
jgi:hypothetical protein